MNNKIYLVLCDNLEFCGLYGNYESAFNDTLSRARSVASNYFGAGDNANIDVFDWGMHIIDPTNGNILSTYDIKAFNVYKDTIIKG